MTALSYGPPMRPLLTPFSPAESQEGDETRRDKSVAASNPDQLTFNQLWPPCPPFLVSHLTLGALNPPWCRRRAGLYPLPLWLSLVFQAKNSVMIERPEPPPTHMAVAIVPVQVRGQAGRQAGRVGPPGGEVIAIRPTHNTRP